MKGLFGRGSKKKSKEGDKKAAPTADATSKKKKSLRLSAKKEPSLEDHIEALAAKEVEVTAAADALNIELDEDEYVELLSRLIGESEHVQNFPPELIPEEDRIVAHIVEVLEPYKDVLEVETHAFVEGRSNVIIRYRSASEDAKNISLVGSHLDVVPATSADWEHPAFELTRDGDKLKGRGTTDCLGHVALITLFMKQLAVTKPELKSNVVAVFISSEEGIDKSHPGCGIDGLHNAGLLDPLKHGSCLWVDSSDSQPCMGTAGAVVWHLTAEGKRFHSGLPNLAINPIELVSEAVKHIQSRFYADFPALPEEKRYNFMNPSTLKPTQMKVSPGSLNQIPGSATCSGDARISPFYSCEDVIAAMERYVAELNESNFAALETRGPVSKFHLEDEPEYGKLVLEWGHNPGDTLVSGVACDLDSPAFLALTQSVQAVRGEAKPFSVSGSLPLVRSMKDAGFDLQIVGFGLSAYYHANNEMCLLSDMAKATKILSLYVSKLDAKQ